MPTVEHDFHRSLYSLLDQELAHMGELKQILDTETAILTYERDADGLLQLITNKDAKVKALKTLEEKRERLLAGIGINNQPREITDFLSSDEQLQPLLSIWQQLLELTTQCQASNRLNGTIIKLDHQHLQQALNLLRAENTDDRNYDPKGCQTASSASRLLGQA